MDIDRLPAPLRIPYRRLRASLTTSLWALPTLGILVGVGLAIALVGWDPDLAALESLDPAASRATVTTLVSAVVAAISLVVTGTIVAVQVAAGQFSPRLLRDAVEDKALQVSLAVLVGTVAYGLWLLPQLGDDDPPRLAVAVAVAAGMADVGLLVLFLRKIVQRLRLEAIIGRLVRGTMDAIDRVHPMDTEQREVELPDDAMSISARRSGYVRDVALDALARAGTDHGLHVRVRPRIGTFLVAGTDAAYVWPADGGEPPDDEELDRLGGRVDAAITLGVDRTLMDDPGYGIRHLVDIACRAVSPGINDPTTAVQCIDNATGLLVELSRRPLHDSVVEHDGCTATVSRPDFEAMLELAQTQVLLYGGRDPWVLEALVRQLRDVAQGGADDARRRAVADRARLLREHLDASDYTVSERAIVESALSQVNLDTDEAEPTDEADNPAS